MKAPETQPEGVFHSRRLPGGLEAWVWRRRGLQNKFAVLAARFGAVDACFESGGEVVEVPDGTAHFLEHKAFETGEGSALGLFSRLGVRANAFTSFTATAYHFVGTGNFFPALGRLIELVTTSRLTPEGVEAEKKIIAQEIRMYQDSPGARVFENLHEALYAVHPVRRRIAGTVESIGGITPEVLTRCHETFYHPSNLTLVAAGDLDPERVFDAAAERLRSLGVDTPAPDIRRVAPEEPVLPARRRVTARMPVRRSSFLVGFKDHPAGRTGEDLLRREVTLSLLGDVLLGTTSDLYTGLYREGLIDHTFSYRYTADRTFAYFIAGGRTISPDEVSRRLLEGICARRQNGITGPELERKRRRAAGRYVGLFDSLQGMSTVFLTYRLKGVDLDSYPDVLRSVTLEEVNEALGELFVPEKVSVSIVSSGQSS